MTRGGKPSRLDLKMDLRHADRMKFSPDGSMMAAHVTTPAGFQIVVEDLATHVVRRLTPAEGNYGFPCWSRDGNWIAAEDRTGGRTSLVYLPAKGGEIRRVNLPMTQTMVHDWSPDSTRIAFAGLANGVWNLYWVSRETGKLEQLTHFTSRTSFVRYPAWSPRNDRIVFERNDLSANIYVADLR
jgi:Tol biopolymer transport system component